MLNLKTNSLVDTFAIFKADDSTGTKITPEIAITSTGIAWPEDKKYKFKNLMNPSKDKN